MKNNYGLIYIDLGEQDFTDQVITASLSEETKKTLLELVNKIDKTDENAFAFNPITKIPYIHLRDTESNIDIKKLGTIYTTDDGYHIIFIDFIAKNQSYILSCYATPDNELVAELLYREIQFVIE